MEDTLCRRMALEEKTLLLTIWAENVMIYFDVLLIGKGKKFGLFELRGTESSNSKLQGYED